MALKTMRIVFSLVVAVYWLTIPANSMGAEPIEAQVYFSGKLSEQTIPMTAFRNLLQLQLRAAIEKDILQLLQEKFDSVKVVQGNVIPQEGFVVEINAAAIAPTVSYTGYFSGNIFSISVPYSVSFILRSSNGEKHSITLQRQKNSEFTGLKDGNPGPTNKNTVKIQEDATSLFSTDFLDIFKTFLVNPQTIAFIENEVSSSVANIALLTADLKPLTATYRVTEGGAVIRKKPEAKAGVVRNIGVGSQIQVIGQLPSGWLQVAREGEAIGWIHADSAAQLSSQQTASTIIPAQPTVTVVPPRPVVAPSVAASDNAFPIKPIAVNFPRGKPSPDDIAVIIGNANYKATAKDIPDVVPAYADAEGMKRYAVQALGIKEENVIFIKDGRLTDFVATFGNDSNYKGKLFNWVKAGKSNVFVYYSGHGAPSADGSSSYLVPVDAQASLIDLSAYPLRTLYANLAKLPATSVTVVLESCFSGSSQSGTVIKNASPVFQKALQETVPPNLTVISAAGGTQIASWEQDKSSGLFTKYFLLGMAGAADKKPYGNGDGKVTNDELGRYLAETVSYSAQRYYGREQTAQVAVGGGK